MRIRLLYAFLRVEAVLVYTAFGYRNYLSLSLAKFGKGIYRQVPSWNANCAEVLAVRGWLTSKLGGQDPVHPLKVSTETRDNRSFGSLRLQSWLLNTILLGYREFHNSHSLWLLDYLLWFRHHIDFTGTFSPWLTFTILTVCVIRTKKPLLNSLQNFAKV